MHRGSRGTSVEPDALELISLAEQLELGLQAVRRDEGEAALSGTVRISMGEGFVRPATRVLSELRRKHPALRLEVISETRLADLARREADIGLRKSKSSSSVLVERAVGRLEFGLYASQGYVERRLRGGRLEAGDFERHDFVGYEGAMERSPQMTWLMQHGASRFPFRSNSDFALEEAVEQGEGICMMADAQGRTLPGLVRLDVDLRLPSIPVFLVFHKELRQVPRVRLVVGALEAALRHALR
ncbi:LysR substrate-binding domain-containing protein [Pyxidicoccus sp. 3LG]